MAKKKSTLQKRTRAYVSKHRSVGRRVGKAGGAAGWAGIGFYSPVAAARYGKKAGARFGAKVGTVVAGKRLSRVATYKARRSKKK